MDEHQCMLNLNLQVSLYERKTFVYLWTNCSARLLCQVLQQCFGNLASVTIDERQCLFTLVSFTVDERQYLFTLASATI